MSSQMIDGWRWTFFEPQEVLSPDGLVELKKGNLLVQGYALDILESFRIWLGRPIWVNTREHKHRGYRSPRENEEVGGAKYSRHVQGIAFDISVPPLSVEEIVEEA